MKDALFKLRHDRSKRDFPDFDLVEGEYVELAIKRSRWGLILILVGEILGAVILSGFLIFLLGDFGDNFRKSLPISEDMQGTVIWVVIILFVFMILAGMIGVYNYRGNVLIITNKRVIQRMRSSLFMSSTNVIELKSIEDVSFRQAGILDYIFALGTIRMSTVGDETTYTFPYIDTPRDEMKVITDLVHKAKTKKAND